MMRDGRMAGATSRPRAARPPQLLGRHHLHAGERRAAAVAPIAHQRTVGIEPVDGDDIVGGVEDLKLVVDGPLTRSLP